MTTRMAAKLLYIADLLQRMSGIESGRAAMEPLAYRVLARQLRQSAAGFSDTALLNAFGPHNPQIRHLVENRYFAEYGMLPGTESRACQTQARRMFESLGVQLPVVGNGPR